MTVIYALCCPETSAIRYIGKTNNAAGRMYTHIWAARKKLADHHTSRWIRSLLSRGLEPVFKTLFVVPVGDSWEFHERRLIAECLKNGCRLTNQTVGGEGVTFRTMEEFEAAREARKNGITAETRAAHASALRAKWADPEFRSRMIAAQKKAAMKPERRKELSAASRKAITPEREAAQRAAVQLYFSDPANVARHAERMSRTMKGRKRPKQTTSENA